MPETTARTQFTVEELAVATGLPTSTIRMYQTKGLLHAPRRHGRSARYDGSHLDRLRLVQRLQTRGFSLPAIAELLAAHASGASVSTVLGLEGTSESEEWVPVTMRDLTALVPARDLRPGLVRRAGELGLLRWRKGRPYARRWALDSGRRLAELAVPRPDVLDQFARLRSATDDMAEDFVTVFEEHVWPRIAEDATRTDALEEVRALIVQLTETAEITVLGALRESIRSAAETFADRHGLLPADGTPAPWAAQGMSVLEGAEPDFDEVIDPQTLNQYLDDADEHSSERQDAR